MQQSLLVNAAAFACGCLLHWENSLDTNAPARGQTEGRSSIPASKHGKQKMVGSNFQCLSLFWSLFVH
jgi:hypothetical protein